MTTSFRLPNSRAEVHAAQIESMRTEIEQAQREMDRIEGYQDSSLFLTLYSEIAKGQEDAADRLAEECEKFPPAAITDASYDALMKIRVSWQTIRYPNYGAAVLAHEMGHVISKALSSRDLNEQTGYLHSRQCIDTRHGGAAGRYNEEDFADLIAARAMPLLKTSGLKVDNVACMLLEKDSRRWGVMSGLSMALPKTTTDGHSADFYRAVQIQMNSGRSLSPSCQSIVSTYQPKAATSCF